MRIFTGLFLFLFGIVLGSMESIPYQIVSDTVNKISGLIVATVGLLWMDKADSKPVMVGEEPPVNVAYKSIGFIVVLILLSTVSRFYRN